MSAHKPKHARRSPWRWLATFPPAAGLTSAIMLMALPAVASAAPLHLAAQSGVEMQAAAMMEAKPAEGALAAVVLARRETAQDHRQEALQDALQAARVAALAAAQSAAQQALRAAASPAPASVPPASSPAPAGDLSFGQLEALWVSAGGPASQQSEAATVAMCESGGNPDAENSSGASGLWQILGQVVAGNIFDPMVNAENAVAKYNAAGGWSPWVCAA